MYFGILASRLTNSYLSLVFTVPFLSRRTLGECYSQVLDEGTRQGPVTLLGSEHLKDSRTAPTDMKRPPETCETLVCVFLPFLLEGASVNFKEKRCRVGSFCS